MKIEMNAYCKRDTVNIFIEQEVIYNKTLCQRAQWK